MVTSVVPTACVSTACGLACGYRAAGCCWASAGTANRSARKANLRIVARILAAVRPDEETILQQHAPAAAVDDLDLQVGALGDARRTLLDFAQETRLLGRRVPREALPQPRVVEEERRHAHAAVLQQQRDGPDAVRREGEAGDVEVLLDGLPRIRELQEAEGAGVIGLAPGEEGLEVGRALHRALRRDEPIPAEAIVVAPDEAETATVELVRQPGAHRRVGAVA